MEKSNKSTQQGAENPPETTDTGLREELLNSLTPYERRNAAIDDLMSVAKTDPEFQESLASMFKAWIDLLCELEGAEDALQERDRLIAAAPSVKTEEFTHCIQCDTGWNTNQFLSEYRKAWQPVAEDRSGLVERLDTLIEHAAAVKSKYRDSITSTSQLLGKIVEHLEHSEILRYANGAVYLIENLATGHYKIGWSKHPESRLKSLQSANAGELKLVSRIPGSPADEVAIHKKLDAFEFTLTASGSGKTLASPTSSGNTERIQADQIRRQVTRREASSTLAHGSRTLLKSGGHLTT